MIHFSNGILSKKIILSGYLIFCYSIIKAQSNEAVVYNATTAFALPENSSAASARTPDGRPGAGYRQNQADYQVAVSFDTASRVINGVAQITYTNNSEQTLPYIWLVAGQNRFRKDSRVAQLTPAKGTRFGVQEYTAGCEITSMETGATKKTLQTAAYQVTDSYLKVMLSAPLLPGKKTTIRVGYHFQLPYNGSDYMGILNTAHGAVYQLGSMFPRVAVYDDIQGWNVLSSGYFVEPGTLDVRITVPAGLIVQGTGELKNPEEVLSPALLTRYRHAWKSDTVVSIRSAAEVTAPAPGQNGSRTWRFVTGHAGDGMWGISAAFCWDAVKVNLPSGRTALAMALYPPESNPEWRSITGQMKRMLEMYSGLWTPYPYTTSVNIAGSITGVAAPAVAVIDYRKSSYGNTLWTKTNHELGHTWFNIMIAADSKHGWMAEGLNTFINLVNCDTLRGEGPFKVSEAVNRLSANIGIPALNTPAASVRPGIMAMVMYIKPAVALSLLRNKIIGKEKFDPVFRDFMTEWAFKHPAPGDFFRMMENGTGEDLGWFWRGWFLNDWKLDQAIKEVVYVNNDPAQGVNITMVNRGEQVMPVDVEIRETNGKSTLLHFPAQVWQADSVHTFHYTSSVPLENVILDPGREIPDIDRSNNAWKNPALFSNR
jgi:hypothetical protein